MSESKNTKLGPSGFIVVLLQMIIEIPQNSNLSWLPLFYALPPELVNKRPEYAELPRNNIINQQQINRYGGNRTCIMI